MPRPSLYGERPTPKDCDADQQYKGHGNNKVSRLACLFAQLLPLDTEHDDSRCTRDFE